MELILVRHGESEDNVSKRFSSDNTILTGNGVEQIKKTRELLKDYEFSKVFFSPLARTRQTLQILGLSGIENNTIREMDFGIFTGYTFEEFSKKYPEESQMWVDDPFNYNIPNGENIIQTYTRVVRFMDSIKDSKENILAVTHEGIIRLICSYVMDDPNYFFKFRAGNGSITVVNLDDRYKYIKQLNYR
ncbi:MAG: histidine phosphatase family protein [Gudongella sp.]|nr:histidine phosphatase family protein [Gudongella sp.]